MTSNDKDRVNVYRRIIDNQKEHDKVKDFIHLSDEDLLLILNSTIMPNALSLNSLKYSIIFNLTISDSERKKRVEASIKKTLALFKILSKNEKDLIKYGIFYGFNSYNWKYQMNRYITHSSRPEGGDLKVKKIISAYFFERIFPFIYRIITGGEKNESFPRT